VGHPRRLAAQQVLNASQVVTTDVLWAAINSKVGGRSQRV